MTIGMRQLYADYVHKANIDDDVKVLVIKGAGPNIGAGGDLPEQAEMLADDGKDVNLLPEFSIDDPSVKYPPKGSYRVLPQISAGAASGRVNLPASPHGGSATAPLYCHHAIFAV